MFSAAREAELLASGEYFYCKSHLAPIKIAFQSPNPDYCQQCYQSLVNDSYFASRRRPERHKNTEIDESGGFNSRKVMDSLTKRKGVHRK